MAAVEWAIETLSPTQAFESLQAKAGDRQVDKNALIQAEDCLNTARLNRSPTTTFAAQSYTHASPPPRHELRRLRGGSRGTGQIRLQDRLDKGRSIVHHDVASSHIWSW
jgi:hypothetical protein